MKKFGKMRIAAAIALVAALLGSATASAVGGVTAESATPTGFETQAVEITGGNEAFSGWQYYFYNETIKTYYQSNELFVRATKNGRTGNALEIERKKAGDELWIYSYSFAVESGTNYEISSFVKIADASGKLVYCIKEIDENGNDVTDSTILSQTQYIDRHSVSGVLSDWTETSFTRTTEAATKKIVLRIRAEGTGIINIDDLTVKKVIAPNTNMFKMIGVGNDGKTEDPASMPVLSETNLSSDSSDGDGKSLKLNHNDVYKTVFGILPHGKTYNLSFKYKNTSGGTADRMSIRLDNVTTAGERVWYAAPPVPELSVERSYGASMRSVRPQCGMSVIFIRIATTFCMQVKILFAFTHRLTEKRKLNCQNHVRCMNYMKNVTILTILPMRHLIWNAEKHLLSRYVNKI